MLKTSAISFSRQPTTGYAVVGLLDTEEAMRHPPLRPGGVIGVSRPSPADPTALVATSGRPPSKEATGIVVANTADMGIASSPSLT